MYFLQTLKFNIVECDIFFVCNFFLNALKIPRIILIVLDYSVLSKIYPIKRIERGWVNEWVTLYFL